MKEKNEKIFIGRRTAIELSDQCRRSLDIFRNAVIYELNPFIKLEDIHTIIKSGSKEIAPRFEAYLLELNAGIDQYIERLRHQDYIPLKVQLFNEKCNRIKAIYDGLPVYLQNEKLLSFYYEDNKIGCKWDEKLLNQIIQEQCEVYAETPKEIEAINYINEMINSANKLKTLVGIPINTARMIIDSPIQEKATYNVDFINVLFNKL